MHINSSSVLLVIDVQKGLDDPSFGHRNNPDAEENIARLLAHWRRRRWPIVHIRHDSTQANSPLRPELPGNDYKDQARPVAGEKQFHKRVNSAFIGTELENYLRQNGHASLVVVGLTTDHCVSTTVRMAANLGFQVRLVSNATATFERTGHDGVHYDAAQMHSINLASLNGEFCTVYALDELLDEVT